MHPTTAVEAPAMQRADRGLIAALARSPGLWVALVAAFVASPAVFFFTLMLSVPLLAVGIGVWVRRRHALPLAVAVGLLLGSVPYLVAVLARVHGS